MYALKYCFEELMKIKDNKYILQIISNKKLSKVYHYHDFYEIILILKGSTVHTVNKIKRTMNIGDCVIILPGDAHCFESQSDSLELIGLSVSFDEFVKFSESFCADIPVESDSHKYPNVFSCISELNEIRNISERCCSRIDNVNDRKLLLCIILNLYCANNEGKEDDIPPILNNAAVRMREIENIKAGVSALVNLTNYSYPHLFRLMKRYYNKSPHEFIADLRLESAYSKVILSDTPIEDISESVGYNSISHFNVIFKKRYGVSPAALRKEYKGKNTL